MEKNRRIISIVTIGLFLLVAATLAYSITSAEDSDQQFLGFDLAGYGSQGQKSWQVKGRSADIFDDVVKLKDVDAMLYGQEDMRLTAKRGDFDKVNSKFHLEEDVVATTLTGSKITTDSLDWAQATNMITTDDNITVERENMTATSKGAEAEPNLNKAKMIEDVVVEIKTQDEESKAVKKTIITCDGPLEIDYQAQIAVFNNNVKVNDDTGEIYSDKMEVYFDFENKTLNQIVAIGNVKIVRGENISYSEKAVYTAGNKKVVLTGRPKLILYSDKGMEDVSFGN